MSDHSLAAVRNNAVKRYQALGYPTQKNEDWKYTNLYQLKEAKFPAPALTDKKSLGQNAVVQNTLAKYSFAHSCLVFGDGVFLFELSKVNKTKGLEISTLSEAIKNHPEDVLEAFNHGSADKMFTQMNMALATEGYFILVQKNTQIKEPLVFIYFSSQEQVTSQYKNTVIVKEGGAVEVVEVYKGVGEVYFNNSTTQVKVEGHGTCQHVKIQEESRKSYHIHELQISQEKASTTSSHVFSLGGALVRNEIDVLLKAPESRVTLNGLFVGMGNQHIDNKTFIDHASPSCQSEELYKGILDENSQGVFNGKILVRKDSQKTDAKQANKNLLLSETAQINTLPQLMIFADDVKCAHGATIGQLDKSALFYIQSRGIKKSEGVKMLTKAFATEMVHKLEHPSLREVVEGHLKDWFDHVE